MALEELHKKYEDFGDFLKINVGTTCNKLDDRFGELLNYMKYFENVDAECIFAYEKWNGRAIRYTLDEALREICPQDGDRINIEIRIDFKHYTIYCVGLYASMFVIGELVKDDIDVCRDVKKSFLKGQYDKVIAENEALKKRIAELETMVAFQPGGDGYQAAKSHFEGSLKR